MELLVTFPVGDINQWTEMALYAVITAGSYESGHVFQRDSKDVQPKVWNIGGLLIRVQHKHARGEPECGL
jgi:hypothetical protein